MVGIDTIIELDNQTKIAYFLIVFVLYYLFAHNSANIGQNIFIILFIIIVYIIVSINKENKKIQNNDIEIYIHNLEKLVKEHDTQEMIVRNVYKIHKPLIDIRHIKKNNDMKTILYDLKFLQIYDKEDFIDIVIMIEYFFKIHFNIMIGKYDVKTFVSILHDIRNEMLNLLYASSFNIPVKSQIYDNDNLNNTLDIGIKRLQSLTYKYIKVIYNKYKNILKHDTYRVEQAFDSHKDAQYYMIY
jgi:hypothetical protein